MTEGTPTQPPESSFSRQPSEPSTHGYWGPLPGESPELYKSLGAPGMERVILTRIPEFWRGDFSIKAGRDLEVEIPQEKITPLDELTRQERLERFVRFTQKNELAHIVTFVAVGFISVGESLEGGWAGIATAVAFSAVNIIVNIPPILVQRYNRLRAYRLLDRMGNSPPTSIQE